MGSMLWMAMLACGWRGEVMVDASMPTGTRCWEWGYGYNAQVTCLPPSLPMQVDKPLGVQTGWDKECPPCEQDFKDECDCVEILKQECPLGKEQGW